MIQVQVHLAAETLKIMEADTPRTKLSFIAAESPTRTRHGTAQSGHVRQLSASFLFLTAQAPSFRRRRFIPSQLQSTALAILRLPESAPREHRNTACSMMSLKRPRRPSHHLEGFGRKTTKPPWFNPRVYDKERRDISWIVKDSSPHGSHQEVRGPGP